MPTWAQDIVSALERLGGTSSYSGIYAEVQKLRSNLPSSWQFIVQREIQRRSSESSGYEGRQDLFFSVEGLGNGIWGLRSFVTDTPVAADLPEGEPDPGELPLGNDAPGRVESKTYRILRDTKLARELKLLHRNQCQLCGLALEFPGGSTYSEAHHVIPLGSKHNGPDTPGNVIVLCPNHHALCDAGAIPLLRSEIRSVDGHLVSDESLSYHNEKIVRLK
jgi:5-methylcytosine-specific restriction endonuclease McrA